MGTGEVLGGDDANHSVTAFAVGVEQRVGDKWAPLAPLRVTISPVDASAWDWAFLLLASLAVFVVWLGAYVSSRKERAVAAGDPNASRIDDTMHVELTNRAAMTFLACSSLALVVLFFFIGYLVYLLIALFTFIGAMALFELLIGSAEERCPPHWRRPLFSLPFVGDVTPVMLACFLPSATLALVWVVGRKAWWAWPLQDLLGVAILVTMQRAVRLTSIRVSTVLLTLAFFYDIFWVFLSPFIFRRSVMITVATGGDSGESPPMLLVIPKLVHEGPGNGFSMLGLGDVALPGLLLSMLMRFDLSNALSGLAGYFVPALIGYAVGLAAAGIAVAVTLSGQPALLYLVPCTLGLTVLLAWHRGHLGVLWRGRGRGDPENVPLSAQEAQSATAGGFSMLSQDDEVASDEDDAEPRASIQASRPNAEDATAPAGAPTPV
jgi:signal peptide peptidase-like protein 2B